MSAEAQLSALFPPGPTQVGGMSTLHIGKGLCFHEFDPYFKMAVCRNTQKLISSLHQILSDCFGGY